MRSRRRGGLSSVFLRLARGGSFLPAVAVRVALCGACGQPNVARVDFACFTEHAARPASPNDDPAGVFLLACRNLCSVDRLLEG